MASYALLGLATLQGVRAWGVLGHATIAYIAQNYVTSEVESWAQGVLGDTSNSYLANIASWADDYRKTTAGTWSAALHFIDAEDNPPTTCDVDYTRDCGSKGCSVSAMANYTQRVGDGSLSANNTMQALMFLVHFVGDITQPLHDEAYEAGGNHIAVHFVGSDDNLHTVWDTYMPDELIGGDTLADALSWSNTLTTEINSGAYESLKASWIEGDTVSDVITTAMRWASDANALVCTVVMPNGPAALTAMSDLYPTYYDQVIPTIELQIAKAGYRLGNWLNLIYAAEIVERDLAEKHGGLTLVEQRRPGEELDGGHFLPAPRELSAAKKARELAGHSCSGHKH